MDIYISITALGNGANAVIRTIRATSFDVDGSGECDEFQRTIDIDSCIKLGMTVDGRSLLAWKDQEKDEPVPVQLIDALRDLRSAFSWEGAHVWTDITTHSAAVLGSAYRRAGLSVPWQFWNLRDVTTAIGTPLLDEKAAIKELQLHYGLKHAKQA